MANAEAGPSRAPAPVPDTGTPPKSRRRSWFDFSSPSSSSALPGAAPRKSSLTGSRRGSKVEDEEVEMSEPGASRLRSSITSVEEGPKNEGGEEILTIDGKVERDQTIKKKKKKKSIGTEEEVVRLKDLKGSTSRDDLKTSMKGLAYDPGGERPGPFRTRTFSRTASDRDPLPLPPPVPSPPHLTPPSQSESQVTSTPPLVLPLDSAYTTPSDRPLPPIPGSSDDKRLPDVPLIIPKGIVVTPSSPRKLTKRPNGSSSSSSLTRLGERRSRSAGRSRSSSQTRKAHSARSSPIGIGLPRSLGAEGEDPPPLPSKPQSVSSPFPSRGNSPTPRIAFAELDGASKDREDKGGDGKEKKTRLKRARSLSGMLGKAPQIESKPPSRPHTPDGEEEEETVVKASGVLGWFGVKKTVKRRQSENKLQTLNAKVGNNHSREASPHQSIDKDRRESLGVEEDNEDNTIHSRRPDFGTQSSSVTVMPNGSQSRRGIFGRRSSSRGPESSTSPRPVPININTANTSRLSVANSSQSSLQLPLVEPISPGFLNTDNWASSPPEGEETLFSPESGSNWGPGVRPWMDGMEGGRSTRSSISITSPLDSLPEQGPPNPAPALKPPPINVSGRVRSWSDAPLPQATARPANSSNPHLPTDPTPSISQSLHTSPLVPARPKMPGRSSSNNSVIMGRMRNVFAKTTSRGRSQTLIRQPSSDVDEFGNVRSSNDWPSATSMRPSSSSSSEMNSPSGRAAGAIIDNPQLALLGLSGHERQIFLNDTPGGSPRTSLVAASISSVASGSTHRSALLENGTGSTRGRARASTMSAGPTSFNFVPPSSPRVFPISATPPRRRPSVIQRLSSGVLRSSGPSSPRSGSLFPHPPRSSGSVSSGFTGATGGLDDTPSSATSPRPSAGSISAAVGSAQIKAASARADGDTPETWLERVTAAIGRNEIANVLASSGDDFFAEALRLHMSHFDFTHNALDVALRRLLMYMSLPRETQQIDRIVEAFSVRYEECEPGLFVQKDNTYVLAFSMMMLHTDAFNRHNKNKMAKADYVRNTRMEGVPSLVLEAFYDNITFTPFVFIEDDSELARATMSESASATTASSMSPNFGGATLPTPKNGKIDVYHMIVGNMLGSLRVDMESEIPPENPFSCLGTRPFMDTEVLHGAFASARNLAIVAPKRKNSAAGLLSSTPSKTSSIPEPEMLLKVTKVGLISRKDDSPDNAKKSSRKWRSWSVILTGSQLLFFKDPMWALTLIAQARSPILDQNSGQPILPRMTNFKPDEVFPVKDCIAVFDHSYTEYPNTFRFVMPPGRQYLLQAPDEYEMNEWITLINYASTFKTANVRMRGTSMGKDRAVLAGAAAAASHKRELQEQAATNESNPSLPRTPRKAVFGDAVDTAEKPMTASFRSETANTAFASESTHSLSAGITAKKRIVDVDGANDTVANEGERLEEVFDVVKAELAAGRGGATKTRVSEESSASEKVGAKNAMAAQASRSDQIKHQIRQFEKRKAHVDSQHSANLRIARNLAILTPFQKSTRDRIASHIPTLSMKLRDTRLELAKLDIWITVLRKDLEAEQRDWARVRHVALQAAAKSLRDPLGVKGVVQDVNAGEESSVPTLALPIADSDDRNRENSGGHEGSGYTSDGLSNSPGELPVIIRRPSDEPVRGIRSSSWEGEYRQQSPVPRQMSIASYRSSTSVSSSRPELRRSSSDLLSAKDALSRPTSPLDESTGNSTPILFPITDVVEQPGQKPSVHEPEDPGTIRGTGMGLGINFRNTNRNAHDHGYGPENNTRGVKGASEDSREQSPADATGANMDRPGDGEQAEDWRKTKAAKRVSLANIPTDMPHKPPQSRHVSQEKERERSSVALDPAVGTSPGLGSVSVARKKKSQVELEEAAA